MQAMMDVCSSERDMFWSRAEETEQVSRQLEDQIDVLNQQIADLEAKNSTLYRAGSAIFKEVDIVHLKEDQEAHAAMIKDDISKTLIDENKALRDRCGALDQRIVPLRKELRSSNDRVDDLTIKVAARVGVRVVLSLAYRSIQCELASDTPPPEPIIQVVKFQSRK
jgi:chromosome segregation ATPase